MTVDREQILRDAEWLAQIQTGVAADRARLLGADLLALLTELEEAEKILHAIDLASYALDVAKHANAVEARLAKAVEALERIAKAHAPAEHLQCVARVALAAWESE